MTGRSKKHGVVVNMVALHSFSGPEGSPDGSGNGAILKGQEFQTTEQRAYHLEAVRKANRIHDDSPVVENMTQLTGEIPPLVPQTAPNTELLVNQPGVSLDGLSIDKIRAAIAQGAITAAQAYNFEMSRPEDDRRKTLLEEMKALLGHEDDGDDDSGDSTDDEE